MQNIGHNWDNISTNRFKKNKDQAVISVKTTQKFKVEFLVFTLEFLQNKF